VASRGKTGRKGKTKEVFIYSIDQGLESEESKQQYKWHFDRFLKWAGYKYSTVITPAKVLEMGEQEPKKLQNLIIEYLSKYMHEQKGLKHATIKNGMSAILHFLDINDIELHRKKISKFIPPDEQYVSDKAYTKKDIQKLLDTADSRYKTVILLLANGMRIGALPGLELRDLEEISLPGQPKIYKIWVYSRSKKHRYYTFVTPECSKQIDGYLQFRKNEGEKDVSIHPDNTSPLIRDQFTLGDRVQASKPQHMALGTIEKTLERIIIKSGIGTLGTVMMSHGFRKYAITMMKKAKVDFSDREYLVGHRISRGLDVNYDRTTEEERLEEWGKAINFLQIDKSFQLEKELEIAKTETAQEIASLKADNEMFKERLRQAGLWDSCD